jgi:hypothetical protein
MPPADRARLLAFASLNASTSRGAPGTTEAGAQGLPAECVTPHDLQRSPNLKLIGRLSEKASPNLPESSFLLFVLVVKEFLAQRKKTISRQP